MPSESSRGPGPNPTEHLPLPDWLQDDPAATAANAPLAGTNSPNVTTATLPIGGNIGDTQPNPTIYFGPQTEASEPGGEVKPRGIDAAKLALYGFIEARARSLSERAENREDRLERKEEFYSEVGDLALSKLVEKPQLPVRKVSDLGMGIRGRGMNRANMSAAPEGLMQLRFTPEEARERKARRAAGLSVDEPNYDPIRDFVPREPDNHMQLRFTPEEAKERKARRAAAKEGPDGQTIVEKLYKAKLKRRTEAYGRSQKTTKRLRNSDHGVYRPWMTRAKRLKNREAPPVIGRTPTEKSNRLGKALRRKRVQWPAEQQIGHRWRKNHFELADKVRNGSDDVAYKMSKKQADIRRAAAQKQKSQS